MPKDTDMESKDKEDPKLVGVMILLCLRWHLQPLLIVLMQMSIGTVDLVSCKYQEFGPQRANDAS